MYLFRPKIIDIIKNGITKEQLIKDVMAGLVVGIVALPLAIAFAVASGVSPEKGIITAIIAGFLISFFGGSRVQIGGPTGAFIIIILGVINQYGYEGLIISTILAGFFLVIFGLVKLGSLLKYFPHPLIVGFTSGIAVVIFSTQVKDALGFSGNSIPSEFIDKWYYYLLNLNEINYYSFLITLATVIIIVFAKKITSNIPGSVIALIVLTFVVYLFELPVKTIESYFGEINTNFTFSIPDFSISDLGRYIPPALTIAFLGAIESLLSAVVADGMIGSNHRSNTELIAQGIANIVTPFLGGIPATGAIARTATNVKNGGRTPIAGIVHAIVLLLILLFLAGLAKLIPMSCLAGVLIVVAYNMSEWRSFLSVLKGSWFDSIVLLSTFFLTVLVDLTVAIQVGIVLASFLFMKRMTDINKNSFNGDVDKDIIEDYSNIDKNISIYEISGPFFFGTAKSYSEVLKVIGGKCKILIIRMRHVPFIDSTGIHNFNEVIHQLTNDGVIVFLSGVNEDVKKELTNSRTIKLIGDSNVFDSFSNALNAAKLKNDNLSRNRH